MEQHPVPQPITSYEFRLVGDMTIKQFGKLAAGVILALITYAVNPPGFIKWPLIVLFTGIGFGMAFVPFEGRPLDAWIVAFFKRIYSPTLFIWQSKTKTESLTGRNATSVQNLKQTPGVNIPPKVAPVQTPPVTSAAQIQTNTTPAPKPISSPQTPLQGIVPPKQVGQFTIPYIPKETIYREKRGARVDATFSTSVVIPAVPSMPNLIVGFIHTLDGKIIDSAILEIRDLSGNPVRALKSNRLGQFQTATPLPNGGYEIEVDKEGFAFDIIKINLEGKVLPPIEIISK